MKYPIYILSKERANCCFTADCLIKEGITFFLVVEKYDYPSYKIIYKNTPFIILDAENRGLSYARNFVKKYSQKNNENYHWQFDDDIKFFSERIENKNIKSNPNILSKIENYVSNYSNIALSGCRDAVFAWTLKDELSYNKQIASALLINNNNNLYWNKDIIEDTDYALSCLYAGYCTVIFNRILYSKKPDNIGVGGQNSMYINYKNREDLERNLIKKYYPHFRLRLNKKLNIYKVAPSNIWSKFNQRPIPL